MLLYIDIYIQIPKNKNNNNNKIKTTKDLQLRYIDLQTKLIDLLKETLKTQKQNTLRHLKPT